MADNEQPPFRARIIERAPSRYPEAPRPEEPNRAHIIQRAQSRYGAAIPPAEPPITGRYLTLDPAQGRLVERQLPPEAIAHLRAMRERSHPDTHTLGSGKQHHAEPHALQPQSRRGLAAVAAFALALATKLLPESMRSNPVIANAKDAVDIVSGITPSYDSYIGERFNAFLAIPQGDRVDAVLARTQNALNSVIANVTSPSTADAIIPRHEEPAKDQGNKTVLPPLPREPRL